MLPSGHLVHSTQPWAFGDDRARCIPGTRHHREPDPSGRRPAPTPTPTHDLLGDRPPLKVGDDGPNLMVRTFVMGQEQPHAKRGGLSGLPSARLDLQGDIPSPESQHHRETQLSRDLSLEPAPRGALLHEGPVP